MAVSFLGLGEFRWSRVHCWCYGWGWVNRPGSGSVRIPRLTMRLSLERMPSVFFGRMGRSEGFAQVAGPHRASGVGEDGQDLLVGRMVRRGGRRGRFGDGEVVGDAQEGLSGDPQVVGLFVEFAGARPVPRSGSGSARPVRSAPARACRSVPGWG